MDLSTMNRYLKDKRSKKIAKDKKKTKVKLNPKGLLGDEDKRQRLLKEALNYEDYEN